MEFGVPTQKLISAAITPSMNLLVYKPMTKSEVNDAGRGRASELRNGVMRWRLCLTGLAPPDISNRGTMETTPSKELEKVHTRKPYTITKRRENWTDEEHNKFLDAIELYGRAWQRIQEHVGTKTAVQIRSHAQKFFLKLQKGVGGMCPGHPNGIEIPPPRPKRKPFHPSNEVNVNNLSESLAWPSADKMVVDSKRKKPAAHTTVESMNQAERASVYCLNDSAPPLLEHLPMIEESINKTGKYLHLFEKNGNLTNPQMNFTPEERYQVLLKKMDKPITSSNHSLQDEERYQSNVSSQFKGSKCSGASFTEHQEANSDLNLSLSPTRSVTYRSKDPAISSTNSFTKLLAEAGLLEHPFMDFSALSDASINIGKARDKHVDISSSISTIIAATVEAASAWWRLNGLLPSPFQSSISSATQTKASKDVEGNSGTNENTKLQSCSTLLEPSSSSPEIVERKYTLSSILEGINEVNQVPSKKNTYPFSEAENVRQFRNDGRLGKPYNDRPKQGPLAFEALFSQKVLPQSFGPMHMDDGELELNLGIEKAIGLQVDLNRKIFNAEEEKPLSFKDCTEDAQ